MFKSSFRGASLPLVAVGASLGFALAGCGGGSTNLPAPGSGDGTLGGGNGGGGGPRLDVNTIVFVSTRDGNPEIYSINANGTNPTRLTNSPATDEQPSRSADGRSIVFSSQRDGNSEIYKMNSDGTNVQRLTNDTGPASDAPIDVHPVFSPDGTKIVWQSTRAIGAGAPAARRLYIMDATGANQRPVVFADNNRESLDGSWNPDNTRLLGLITNANNTGGRDLAVISPGNGAANLATATVSNPINDFAHPRYSPSGTRIVVADTPVARLGRLRLLNADGSVIGDGPMGGIGQASPSFNPAGTRLVWDASATQGQARQLYVSDTVASGTQPTGVPITSLGENYDASWTQ